MSLRLNNPTLLKHTKEILELHSTEFADYFYQELFNSHPPLATTFRNTDLSKQKAMLIEGIHYILEHLDNEGELRTYLFDLGVRHICYEVTEDQYPMVKEVLLKSIQQIHRSEWNSEFEQLWLGVISLITEHMLTGSRWRPEESQHVG